MALRWVRADAIRQDATNSPWLGRWEAVEWAVYDGTHRIGRFALTMGDGVNSDAGVPHMIEFKGKLLGHRVWLGRGYTWNGTYQRDPMTVSGARQLLRQKWAAFRASLSST